ncbi:uncharacterized threonine-rich GPI-anchored glycoprotein PJ4664.02-like isoform X2 [Xiphophorus maculatus]|uniref:uncharacterized threonine-rich GPI-anchored glycoprotein PJ4664.02-like isoform X2 n=1 Tax=Xiphophorus maculatus TaxID=8083 RepID=UPI000C6ED048|nr:uncharacterized threonine-rich GPI-anchored glycoprotein PJ4664.02-like isoform X2 [Xiphophorus maculatus]
MALCLKILVVFALVVTVFILETRNRNFQFYFSARDYLVEEGEHILPHIRQERSVLSDSEIYSANILLNASSVGTYEQLLSTLNATSYPLQLDNATEIQDITVTTVCVSTETGFQCECEEQFAWPYSSCITYGACDSISSGVCKCISAIPADGSSCQLISELLVQTEYVIDLELNLTDIATVDFLRRLLSNGSNFLTLSPTVNVTQLDLSTVCSPISGDYQCRCEDQYRFPCDQCVTYGSCDNITGDTCGCISGIPAGGQYCQAEDQYNFTACPITTTPQPTSPPVFHQYLLSIELNSTDVTVVEKLRNINNTISMNRKLRITDVNITTVCSPISGDYQCRCEDQYRFPCDQCVTYGPCDNITDDTCGCISGIPAGGQYCQAEDQYNFTACPRTSTTVIPTTDTTSPEIRQYLLSFELKTTDVRAVEELRNITSPIGLSSRLLISVINISTVCSPYNTSYQCRCEAQYGWPCDMCSTYGQCSNVQGSTCGCINALLPNNTYCQPLSDLDSCPTQSPTTEMMNTTTPGTTVMNTTTPATTVMNTTTPGTTVMNTTTPGTTVMNITTLGTTVMNTTTPGTTVMNITTLGTTVMNTTTPATTVMNTTTPGTTVMNTTTPVTTVMNTTTPGTTVMNTTTPGTTVMNITTLGTTVMNTTTPGTTVMNTTTPGTTVMNTTTPGTTVMNITTLGTTVMNTTTPGTTVMNTTTPGTTVMNITTLGTTVVNTTTPGTTVMNTTTPGTTVMNITTPATTVMNTTAPGTTVVDTTTPGTTVMNTTTPGTTVMNITTPATTVMNTTAPGTTVVDTTTPGTTVMNTTTPGTTVMNTTTPGTTVVDTTTPGTTVMNTTTPGTTVVDTTTPGTTVMNTTTPGTTVVDTTTPGTTVVDTTTPETTIMNTTTPGTTVMNTTTSGTTVMNTTTPGTTVVDTTTPGTTVMNTTTPETTVMNTTTSGTTVMNTTTPGTTVVDTTTSGTTVVETTTTGTTVVDTTTSRTTVVETTTTGTTVVDTTTPRTTVMNTTTSGTTITSTTVTVVSAINMSVELNMDFIEQYNNPDSPEYKILSRNITVLLEQQYRKLNGFLNVSVTKFRKGSVVTDFTVKVKSESFDVTALNSVNSKLPAALISIAPVIGSVTAKYYSSTHLGSDVTEFIYTGKTMTLTCDPTEAKMGNTKNPVWKFNNVVIGSHRHKPFISESQYKLAVENVILGDAGNYECSVQGDNITFIQDRNVGTNEIRSAPNVRVQQTMLAKCKEGKKEPVVCCVQSPYTVRWYDGSTLLTSVAGADPGCIKYEYPMQSCSAQTKLFTCKVAEDETYSATATLTIFTDPRVCYNDVYGSGRTGDKATAMCPVGLEGHKSAVCQASGEWKLVEDSCIVTKINELLINSVDLKEEEIQVFSTNLSKVVSEEEKKISQSSATISAIVNILNIIAEVSKVVTKDVMKNVLDTVDVLISDDAKDSWNFLNSNETQNSSSALLGSMETISNKLDGNFTLSSRRIQMGRSKFSNSFSDALTSNVSINLQNTGLSDVFITTIVFSTLHNIMPSRNSSFNLTASDTTSNETKPDNAINAAVLLVKLNETIRNVTLSYQKFNTTLELNPQCVFWNFSLLDNLGAWDDQGCRFVSDINDTVTCTCNHLTSFSILMSTAIPEELRLLLDIMTYIGVGISMISLIICLIIEGIVWRPLTKNSTAFMRHVAIVNTALSLLIADICFIIGAAISKNPAENPGEDYKVPVGPCSAATFFMHFFYLAMFFWMLDSSLLLLYRSVLVFSQMSKWTMFAIGLTVGYVCPLIIAVTTVAATAPGGGYVREDLACWLNWTKTKALLALVIPALAIVVFNILVILVVLYKMLRRRNTNQADEKHALVVILRCVAILSPLFGLTWCLGIGTMVDPTNGGIHVAFAFFNSLQGFFILVFGTLFDSKIRSLILRKIPALSATSNRTRSTSGGTSALSSVFGRLRRGRNGYHASPVGNSNTSSSGSEAFSNT